MEEVAENPIRWLGETWKTDPLEVLLPAAAGALLAQGLTAVLVLRSHHHILLSLCLIALGVSISRSAAFFVRLARERNAGTPSVVSARELQLLFLPLVAAIALWGMIAPNMGLGIIFFVMSLPHLVLLAHIGKRYARLAPSAALQQDSMIQVALIIRTLVLRYAHRLIALYRYSRVQRSGSSPRLPALDS